MRQLRLFCLPYAGSSSTVYLKWKKYLHASIELVPIELAGRGKRFQENFYENLEEVVDDVYYLIKNRLDELPYAIFGHSMGSWITYGLGKKIMKTDRQKPVHLFFSGKEAPHVKKNKRIIHKLPDAELKDELLKLGGTPEEFFKCRELLDLFMPVLRADYKVIETYKYKKESGKLDCPISVLNGEEDDLTSEDITGWCNHTKSNCTIYNFEGGHFFIHEKTEKVVDVINGILVMDLGAALPIHFVLK